jgi:hypothetical protein
MNARSLRPPNVIAAAVLIGGGLLLALPQHAPSILRLVIVTAAASAGLYALAVSAPPGRLSPFERWLRPPRAQQGTHEVDWIRSKLAGRRQRIPHGPPLPPEILRLLRPLIEAAVERAGVPREDGWVEAARPLLAPATCAVLASESQKRPFWVRLSAPDERGTADAVAAILDDLERLAEGRPLAPIPPTPRLP